MEPFLIGLWHFILTKRRKENSRGKPTLKLIYKQLSQRKYEYIGNSDKWGSVKKVTRWEPQIATVEGTAVATFEAQEEKSIKETTFIDKQVNGNIVQVHMVNSGSGNQAYIVQGDFIVNGGSNDYGKK